MKPTKITDRVPRSTVVESYFFLLEVMVSADTNFAVEVIIRDWTFSVFGHLSNQHVYGVIDSHLSHHY